MDEETKVKAGFVTCSKCGKKKFANPQAMAARLKKFGSKEEMEKSWLCRECAILSNPKKEKKVKEKKAKEVVIAKNSLGKEIEIDISSEEEEIEIVPQEE